MASYLLNTLNDDAHVEITVYYSDRKSGGSYDLTVPSRRTRHLRFNNREEPELISRGTDYSSVIRSDVPIVAQHTRLDSRHAENALLGAMAYPAG
jgi:hypothetical protein